MKIYKLCFLLFSSIFAQIEQPFPPLDLVSIPTAGTLPKGSYTYETILSKGGGMMPRLALGLTENLTLGVSYGIHHLIGDEKPAYNPQVGFQVKYRLYDETTSLPAFLIGITTQGKGKYTSTHETKEDTVTVNRYEQKALGFYFTTSKNWKIFGNFGVHLGISKNSWEVSDGDDDINLFLGFDKEINRSFSLLLEYDAALNDNDYEMNELSFGKGKGYVNAAIRWAVVSNILVELNFNDLSQNSNASFTNREIKIMYSESF